MWSSSLHSSHVLPVHAPTLSLADCGDVGETGHLRSGMWQGAGAARKGPGLRSQGSRESS